MSKIPIVHAADLPDCPCCEDKFCTTHQQHYADCPCVGPGNAEELGYTVTEDAQGNLWAEKKEETKPERKKKEKTAWFPMPTQEQIDASFGFIYRLTLPDGRYYIGKKNFWTNRKKKMACRTKGKVVEKGKKKTVRVYEETDWRTYFSSGHEISRIVEKEGKENFLCEIVELVPKRGKTGTAGAGLLAYRELSHQLQHAWGWTPPQSPGFDLRCLNGMIHVRLSRAAIGD